MQLSRVHIAFLAIMSLFTGVIGPGTKSGTLLVSYAMTDMRVWIFFLLILLVIGFYTAAVRNFRILGVIAMGIFLIISILFMSTLLGNIHDLKKNIGTTGFSWGWVFLIMGVVLLFWSLFRKKSDNESIMGSYLDMTIGVIGSITLTFLAGMIIITSLSFSAKTGKSSILEGAFGTGNITYISGGTLWGNFSSEPKLHYDRGNNTLTITSKGKNNTQIDYIQNGETYTFSGVGKNILQLGSSFYEISATNSILSGSTHLDHAIITQGKPGILFESGNTIFLRSEKNEKELIFLSGQTLHDTNSYILSEDMNHIVSVIYSESGISIEHDGGVMPGVFQDISSIELSSNGNDVMILGNQSGSIEKHIVKNGILQGSLTKNYIQNSYRSNGSHYLYKEKDGDSESIRFDGEKLPYHFDEIRETFLEKDGGSYAIFGRVNGAREYCLFTRYRGNLCGLEAYMNPARGADGTSTIFAGKKDDQWSIYRNTDPIEKDIPYNNTDISQDYFFFDPTNPHSYLFIKKDIISGKYLLLKNGKTLPGSWNDVGVKQIYFGFDNHILLPVQSDQVWKLLEI